ncbi:glycoside hydrolase family 25 protein [Cardinium endosymbiont of Culicoides punctatus]|uniref:glycoside hydrolase family 25 protein n=1 Tax=Cardinium endosymbiont of Culicoides punctatus TaxID=2304601 RepID=UPI001058C0CA|nr:glycoside hydrolase family 25 protein [Cardinium endosymbiont of Culicoides punctatus]TDG94777.1 Lysozyme M1 [Cardinium endosymbiont of Culicoides punctatus]
MNKNFLEGIDVSHHQGNIDWTSLTPCNSNKWFMIAKASEGGTYQDPKFVENFKNMYAHGFRPGAYHRVRFGTGSTTEEQANNLINQLNLADKQWASKNPIISLNLIFSKDDKDDYSLMAPVVEEFVIYLQHKHNITPYISTTQSFWNDNVKNTPEAVKKCPLWIARFRDQEPSPAELPNGWDKWTMWSYSDKGSVPGITGGVALNKMKVNV